MQKLQMVRYTPEMFGKLWERTSKLPEDYPLRYKGFVDYYYSTSPHCELYVALDGEGGVAGFQGVEWMPFEEEGKKYKLGFGSNFYAFKPGTGAYLLMNWLKNSDAGLVFGGSDDMNKFISRSGWSYYPGVKFYMMNRRLVPSPENGWVKMTAKKLLKRTPFRTPLASLADKLPPSSIKVKESKGFNETLLNFKSGFKFRFAPDLEYLTWRYGPNVPFLRYRVFGIEENGSPAGYVILLDNDEDVVVAHADGTSVTTLGHGIIKSISAMAKSASDKRELVVTSSNPEMQKIFESVGFKNKVEFDRPLAMGKMRGGLQIAAPVSEWMVSFGWGDNAVRPPFLGEPSTPQNSSN